MRFDTLVFSRTFALIKDPEASAGIFFYIYSPPKTHFLRGNLQTFDKDGVGFVSDLWHRLSVEHIPDGLDCGPHSLFFPLYLLLSLPFTPFPPSLEDRLTSLGRLALGLHAGVTLQGSLMENLALFHSFSASRRTLASSATISWSIDPGNAHLSPLPPLLASPPRELGHITISDINRRRRRRLIKTLFCLESRGNSHPSEGAIQ